MSNFNVDSHKMMYHPDRVSELMKTGDCFPIYVEIGPTNRCNHRCKFCALDWLEHGGSDIDSETVYRNLENMSKNGVKSIMFAGEGEPLLHKDITRFVENAHNNRLDISMTSNGVLFTPEKADKMLKYLSWIRFSLDAGTPDTYSKIHGTRTRDFEKVMENLRYASALKKSNGLKVSLDTQFLLLPESIKETVEAAKLVKAAGADDIQFKPYSAHPESKHGLSAPCENYSHLAEELEKLSSDNFRVLFRRQTIERLNEGTNYPRCYGLPFFSLIDSKANVIPCNLFYNKPEFYYGNIKEQLFSEIWRADRRKEVLKKLDGLGTEKCRQGCRLDAINKYLHRLKNPEGGDNFI